MKASPQAVLETLKAQFPLWDWNLFDGSSAACVIKGKYLTCALIITLYHRLLDDVNIETPKYSYIDQRVERSKIPLTIRTILIGAARMEGGLSRSLIRSIL